MFVIIFSGNIFLYCFILVIALATAQNVDAHDAL